MSGALRRIWRRLGAFLRPSPHDRDLDAEIAAHLDLAVAEHEREGLSPAEARRQALVRFGGVEQAREGQRDARGLPFLDALSQDVRYALRTLRRDAGFTTVAILILALGIGANVAVFSVVNTLLLRPLPARDSSRLVWIAPPPQKCGVSCATYSSDAYDEFTARTRSYAGVTGYEAFTSPDNIRLNGHGDPVPATGIEVIGNFFQVLGIQPLLGRAFTPAEARTGVHPVALLEYGYWKRQFGGDPAIVGQEIDLNGSPVTVLGVLPESFDFGAMFSPGERTDLIEPLNLDSERMNGNIVTLMGRLKPGVTLGQAQAEANSVVPSLCWNEKYPESCGSYAGPGAGMQLRTLKDYISGRLRRSLIVLWLAVGMILLIACVNLANLLLARTAARDKEFAMRAALGAGRARLLRQVFTESLLLSSAGALLGLGLAWALVAWLARQGSLALPLLGTLRMSPATLGWTVLIAVLAALLFGIAPGLRLAGANLQQALKDSGHGASAGRRQEAVRSVLVVAEVALACVLLVGAGLLLRSFLNVLDTDLGFQPDRAASIKLLYDDTAPSESARQIKRGEIFRTVIERVSALPGVESAGIVDFLPLGRNRAWGSPVPQGKTYPTGTHLPSPLVYVCTPGYIPSMGMRLHGRDFSWSDGPNAPLVVIIDADAARFYWPGQDAVGRVLTRGKDEYHVIGVVDRMHATSVENERGWQIYYPATQQGPDAAQLVVRSRRAAASLGPDVLRTLRALNPDQPVEALTSVRTLVSRAESPRRFFMLLVSTFAGLGLFLAALGIYGVIAYGVTRRTQEIGIRMALGASRGRVQRGVLGRTLSLVLAGVAAGTLAALALASAIQSLLYGTAPTDALTYLAMVALLLLIALAAGYLPARRASRIDPMLALRSQ
ncbi:MAG TPA: ABC transporter permease [Terriglobales bacterium]|nr:ABC transporter permease [Terriglobales bacterium]